MEQLDPTYFYLTRKYDAGGGIQAEEMKFWTEASETTRGRKGSLPDHRHVTKERPEVFLELPSDYVCSGDSYGSAVV